MSASVRWLVLAAVALATGCGGGGETASESCEPESDRELCEQSGSKCGGVREVDSCGNTRLILCGACERPETCGGGGEAGLCGHGACKPACELPDTCGGGGEAGVCGHQVCEGETDPQLCDRTASQCGDVVEVDLCGVTRAVSCGTCASPDVCGGGGTPGVCGHGACEPQSDGQLCDQRGSQCGEITQIDACGVTRTVSCGTCALPDTCGGGGQPGICGQQACQAESDQELCLSFGKDCAVITVPDRCGQSRAINCGTCPDDTTCGGGGVDNVCGAVHVEIPCVPTTTVPSGWSYISNGEVRVGVNVSHGAAIGHLSVDGTNVLDSNDTGRYLQQSYYGIDVGGEWHGEPWPFNPVQGGSSDGVPSPVTEFCNNGVDLYAKTIPMDWGNTGSTPSVMEEWITLEGDLAVFRFRFEYLGDWDNRPRHQEVPALFVRRDLEVLTFYEGGAPWTGASVTQILPNQLETEGNQYVTFNEPWLAYLDSNNRGLGLYKRGEDSATCYRFGEIGGGSSTSYFAMLDTFGLSVGLVHEYTVYAKIGSLGDLRAAFLEIFQSGR